MIGVFDDLPLYDMFVGLFRGRRTRFLAVFFNRLFAYRYVGAFPGTYVAREGDEVATIRVFVGNFTLFGAWGYAVLPRGQYNVKGNTNGSFIAYLWDTITGLRSFIGGLPRFFRVTTN